MYSEGRCIGDARGEESPVPPEEVKRDWRRPGWDPLTARGPGSFCERVSRVLRVGKGPVVFKIFEYVLCQCGRGGLSRWKRWMGQGPKLGESWCSKNSQWRLLPPPCPLLLPRAHGLKFRVRATELRMLTNYGCTHFSQASLPLTGEAP